MCTGGSSVPRGTAYQWGARHAVEGAGQVKAKRSVTVRMATWSARRPWRGVAVWLAFVVLSLAVGSAVGTHQATADDYRTGEAGAAPGVGGPRALGPPPGPPAPVPGPP